MCFCFFKQKTAYEMRISDWSSDVCSSDLDSFRGKRLYVCNDASPQGLCDKQRFDGHIMKTAWSRQCRCTGGPPTRFCATPRIPVKGTPAQCSTDISWRSSEGPPLSKTMRFLSVDLQRVGKGKTWPVLVDLGLPITDQKSVQ